MPRRCLCRTSGARSGCNVTDDADAENVIGHIRPSARVNEMTPGSAGSADMNDQEWLAERFEADRSHLRGIAYRMLGSLTEADDAVQEAWIRLSRADTSGVDNLRAWLTTVVGRVSLNMLRLRKTR